MTLSSSQLAKPIYFNIPKNLNCYPCFPFKHQYFPSLRRPSSIRSGLPASSSHFPAAAHREACHTTGSALWEEDGHTTARQWRKKQSTTVLPTRLQHTQMYELLKLLASRFKLNHTHCLQDTDLWVNIKSGRN